ncbi:hypothetical protein [Halocatena marina]|uniref:Uncharacterized protein n=1 Tax=Halocatena marina TaxID=2934937 RepID=A0ABD5YRI5_9EURY|nr:hypothetical protein [Halocatena marina]
MATESHLPLISIGGVTIGLPILLVGVGIHGMEILQSIGGAIALLSIGLLALHLSRLEAQAE